MGYRACKHSYFSEEEKDKKDEDNNSMHTTGFSPSMSHLASTICGIMAAHLFFEKSIVYLICLAILSYRYEYLTYRSGMVDSKSFIGKVLLRIKWKFELINAL